MDSVPFLCVTVLILLPARMPLLSTTRSRDMDVSPVIDTPTKPPHGRPVRSLINRLRFWCFGSLRSPALSLAALLPALIFSGCQSMPTSWFRSAQSEKEKTQEEIQKILEADQKAKVEETSLAMVGKLSLEEHIQLGERALSGWENDPQGLAVAKAHFRRVLAQNPQHPLAHHRLAVIADLTEDFDTAGRHYAQALKRNPTDAYLLHDAGYSLMLQGKMQESIPYFQRALQISPHMELAGRKLAEAYVSTRQYDLAEQTLKQILPAQAAAAELAALKQRVNPAARPSLFGRIRGNEQPGGSPDKFDPTQQILAEIQKERAIQQQRHPAGSIGTSPWNRQTSRGGMPPNQSVVPDHQIASALSQIDRAGRENLGQPIMIGSQPATSASPGQTLTAQQTLPAGYSYSPSGYSTGQPAIQQVAGQNNASGAAMAAGQVPYAPVATGAPLQQPTDLAYGSNRRPLQPAGQQRTPAANGQYAEIFRGTERSFAEPWPRNNRNLARQQQPPQAAPVMTPRQHNGIMPAAGQVPASVGPSVPSSGNGIQRAEYQPARNENNSHGGPHGQPVQAPELIRSPQTEPPVTRQTPSGTAPESQAYQEAAAIGLGFGPEQMFPVVQRTRREMPGSQSRWNGSQYPAPARHLPIDRAPADLRQSMNMPAESRYVPQYGGNMTPGANSLGQQMPAQSSSYTTPDQYSTSRHWGTQPTYQPVAPPQAPNPLTRFDEQRQAYNDQYNALVQQVHAEAAAGRTESPSRGIPIDRPNAPSEQMRSWQQDSSLGPANIRTVTPPQYQSPPPYNAGAGSNSNVPQAQIPYASGQLPDPHYAANVVVPEPYPAQSRGTYRYPASQGIPASADGTPGYSGPVIIPGQQ